MLDRIRSTERYARGLAAAVAAVAALVLAATMGPAGARAEPPSGSGGQVEQVTEQGPGTWPTPTGSAGPSA
ncbi:MULTISPECIES: hypothetical protein [unclassified Streptomyces]|uniref:hypothetical protein n=1 Tax=unclassified Streptomyces TaxID=2593676 RepID=UPI00139CB44A|nr:hypothetical protein [Streptomyces sp. SHP 1-2]MCW5249899.1 hypothetical protein [Streptomyces sp. SHP 1-2]MYU22396.1 hypothetical protein [Streptomyces sp. SID8352]